MMKTRMNFRSSYVALVIYLIDLKKKKKKKTATRSKKKSSQVFPLWLSSNEPNIHKDADLIPGSWVKDSALQQAAV